MKITFISFILFVLFSFEVFAQCTIQPAIHLVNTSDSITCGKVFTSLSAMNPAFGYGYWIDIEPNTIFTPSPSNLSPIATIDTIGVNNYCYHHFYWITVNDTCRDTSEVVKVKFIRVPIVSAGTDTSVLGLTTTFHGTWDSIGIGNWYLNSGNASVIDQHSPTTSVTVTQTGIYVFIWQVNNFGCFASDTVQITFDTSNAIPSIDDFQFGNIIALPNPFLDYILLKGKLKNQEEISVELLNNLGQTIKNYPNKNLTQGEFTFSIFTPELSKGIYYLKIIVGQKVYFKKLSKL